MTSTIEQHSWISGSRRRAISGPLALGALLFSATTALWSQDSQAYTYSVLHTFTGPPDGYLPYAGLVRDKEGNLYGTTAGGGNSSSPSPACGYPPGCGVVFKVGPKGKETILYNFTGGTDGGTNTYDSTLIRDEAGNLYGTTDGGGDLSCFAAGGCGVVFKVDPAGNETVLYAFTGAADGYPSFYAPTLFQDKAGNLYGTTPYGGDLISACAGGEGCGVVYKIDPAHNGTVLYTFNGVDYNEFPNPFGPLVRDEAGNFYGTTVYAVFKLDPAGNETILYAFTVADGQVPWAGLIRDHDGNLYGTTTNNQSTGTVFKVDRAGNQTVLYSFTGGTDSGVTYARLVRDPAGNLYGTTLFGGESGAGVVYKVDRAGNETVLYAFTGAADGGYPYAGLVLDEDGNLYGTTTGGGDLSGSTCSGYGGCGVVFKLTRAAAGGQ